MELNRQTKDCPYDKLSKKSFFPQLENTNGSLLLERNSDFIINSNDKIISFGSCFASKIKIICNKLNLNYLEFKDINDHCINRIKLEKKGNFSLNYGNIYTAKHFLQLLERVTGQNKTLPSILTDEKGMRRNAFRSNVLSYKDNEALRLDDESHLKNILKAISEATCLVFTLGLTEHWIDKKSNLCVPQVPGCGVGQFEDDKYEFINSTLFSVVDELENAINLIRSINEKIKIILTLSPVPLVATYTNLSAVEANIYSKSLLRQSIALLLEKGFKKVYYFPSFEIMTNPHFMNLNFEDNKRSVSDFGLNSIINHFNQVYVGKDIEDLNEFKPNMKIEVNFNKNKNDSFNPACDEENIYASFLQKTKAF